MYLRSLIIFAVCMFYAQILSATEALISPNNLSRININGALYQPKLHPDTRYDEYYMFVTLDPLNQDSTDYHDKISFWWCKSEQNSFYVTPYIYGKAEDFSLGEANKLDLSFSKTDIDPDTEINIPFQHDKPFSEIVASLNSLALCQTVTADTNLMLDDDSLEIQFIFNLIRMPQFNVHPEIKVDQLRHTTTIQATYYFVNERPQTTRNLRFSKGNPVFSHQVISTEQPYGQWSCDSLGRLHQQLRVTYTVDTSELSQWMQLSGITSEFGDYSVVIDTPETVGQLLTDPSEFSGKCIRIQSETQINDLEHYIYVGASGNLYLARKMVGTFIDGNQTVHNRNILRPTLVKLCNVDDVTTSGQGTFYEGSFYKYLPSLESYGYQISSYAQVGDLSQVVTLTSEVAPLSELYVTDALQNLKIPGQPTMDELLQLFQNIPDIFKPYSHSICVDNRDLPLETQQHISEHFYLMMANLGAKLKFCEYGESKFKTLESSMINPNKWNAFYAHLLKALNEFDFNAREISVEEIHADLADYKFFLSLLSCKRVSVDKFHVYYSSEIQGDMLLVDLLSSKLRYNQVVIHADNNQEFMTSPYLRKLGLLLVKLKMGMRPGQPAEQNDQRIPSLQFKEFHWDADKASISDDVKDKDAYLANRIGMLDPTHLTKISYNGVRESYPKAQTAFVDMLVKLSQTDSPKLSLLDLNGSTFKDATQLSQVIAAISKFSALEKFSWISDGAYQVDNNGLFMCSNFFFSTNDGVVTELLKLVKSLSEIPSLRALGLNMCYLSSEYPGWKFHYHNSKFTSVGKNTGNTYSTDDHRDLVLALLKSMPVTTLELHVDSYFDAETKKWLEETLTNVCRDCCPGYPAADNKRSITIKSK